MAKLFFILSAVLFVQLASCRVVREAPQKPSTLPALPDNFQNSLDDVVKKITEFATAANEQLLKATNVKSNEELGHKIQSELQKGTDTLKGTFEEIKTKVDNPKTREFINNIEAQFTQLIKEDPQVTASSKKLADHVKTTVGRIQTDTERIATKLSQEGERLKPEVEALLKKSFENIGTVVKNIGEETKKLTTN